ncbi:MAG: class I SAM-dependent methyltransferase [Acidimicrobiia bacterium]|nr:class I SAM-dependent methyltransferase [Acidimicrobiia bacterium]
MPLIGGWLSDPTAYHYLPASTDALPGGEVLMSRFEAAGFEQVRRHSMGLGAVQLLVGTRS